jgi:radical SAM protein with 4Fe4S-binding SPASM domain
MKKYIFEILSRKAFKRIENWARYLKPILEPLKKTTFGYSPFPLACIIHLTYRCNLNCFMCCQHIEDYSEILPSFPKKGNDIQELELKEWKKIIFDLSKSFLIKPFLHFSGGEPLIYYGTRDLVKFSKDLGFNLSLITNGWFLSDYAEDFVKYNLDRLHISIDGPEEIHNKIRRKGDSFTRAIESIKKVVFFKEKFKNNKPHITINCTITKENYKYLSEMVKVRDLVKADHLTFQHTVFFDKEREMVEGIEVEKMKEELFSLIKKDKEITIYAYVPKKDWQKYYYGNSDDLGKGCGWNWVGLRIHPNGDVVPCRGIFLGNLANGSNAKKIWNSKEYKKLRKDLLKFGNFPECGRCTHRLF